MSKARAAGITLPFLLNFGLVVDKSFQYLFAVISGEPPSLGDWVAYALIVMSLVIAVVIDSYT